MGSAAQQCLQQLWGCSTCPESQVEGGVSVPIQQRGVCTHLQQEAHHPCLPSDYRQVQRRLVQVVGEVDDAEVLSVINDVGYLLNDTSLPMDDGQVQWRVSVLVLDRRAHV